MARPSRAPLITTAFVALAVADLAYFTAHGMAIFALPLYVVGPIGGDEAAAGIAFGAFAVSALVLRPIAGRLADRFGRRPLLVGGALLLATTFALTAVADSLVVVIGLRLLAGVAEAAFFVASFAALADIAPPERMGEALSYNSLGLYLGLALGPPIGEVVFDAGGYTAVWVGAAVMAAVAATVVLVVGETRTAAPPTGGPLRIIHRPAVPASLGFLTSLIAMGGLLAFASLHATRIGFQTPSLILLIYGGTVVVCRLAFARVPDRVPSLVLGAAAVSAIGVGAVIAAVWRQPAGFVVATVVMAVGVAFSTPAFFSAIFATASPSERGIASGTGSAAIDLGLGIGPILLGFVAAPLGIPWAFAVAAAIAWAGAAWTSALAFRAHAAAR
ncbi:MFS transporter [Agromyces sp. GXQ0307]|uniref:MFS transporter n=1 Tax=Agromyces sp. GXQ0307 TaxID=3377835 RepID=UPI00383AE10E